MVKSLFHSRIFQTKDRFEKSTNKKIFNNNFCMQKYIFMLKVSSILKRFLFMKVDSQVLLIIYYSYTCITIFTV